MRVGLKPSWSWQRLRAPKPTRVSSAPKRQLSSNNHFVSAVLKVKIRPKVAVFCDFSESGFAPF